jgi:hypothetical protein
LAPGAKGFDIKTVITLLMKEAGIHSGWYEIGFAYNVLAGHFNFAGGVQPGILTTIGALVLSPSTSDNANAVDASVVNPGPPVKARKRSTAVRGGRL